MLSCVNYKIVATLNSYPRFLFPHPPGTICFKADLKKQKTKNDGSVCSWAYTHIIDVGLDDFNVRYRTHLKETK